jgi:hypothetical protein
MTAAGQPAQLPSLSYTVAGAAGTERYHTTLVFAGMSSFSSLCSDCAGNATVRRGSKLTCFAVGGVSPERGIILPEPPAASSVEYCETR